MGKHTPLPTDPIARAAEKKRRFAAYRREYKQRKRRERVQLAVIAAKRRRSLQLAARQANIDLALDLNDMTDKQLRTALEVAERWIRE